MTEHSSFSDLGLNEEILDRLEELGYKTPTDIQRLTIPLLMESKDVIGLAQTGSGKTLAFLLPLIQALLTNKQDYYGLILAPTRELALQISDQLNKLIDVADLKTCTILGGVNTVKQALKLAQRPHIIVSTPGRICDHLQNTKGFHLKRLKYLVLDEADKLVDLDFDGSMDIILKMINKDRTTAMFSATITSKIKELEKVSLRNPTKIKADKEQTVSTLQQYYAFMPYKFKELYLANIITKTNGNESVIVFVRSCEQSKKISYMINQLGVKATYTNGKLKMQNRLVQLNKFKSENTRVIIATDVAARGLDIAHVDLVINYDIPTSSKTYIHRVGRTARAGKHGKSITFVTQYDIEVLQRIEQTINKKLIEYEIDRQECLNIEEKVYDAKRFATSKLRDEHLEEKQRKKKKSDQSFSNQIIDEDEE